MIAFNTNGADKGSRAELTISDDLTGPTSPVSPGRLRAGPDRHPPPGGATGPAVGPLNLAARSSREKSILNKRYEIRPLERWILSGTSNRVRLKVRN